MGVRGIELGASGCPPQVDATLRRLLDRYRGPEPSDTVEMFEGEKFFAAFERGIDVDAGMPTPPPPLETGCWGPFPRLPAEPIPPPDRPDCVAGRICFVFYSHLKNVKEVYVTTALDRQAQAVRGQVGQWGRVPQAAWAEARTLSPISPQH